MDAISQLAVIGFPVLIGVVAYYVKRSQDETKAHFDQLDASRAQVQRDIAASFAKEASTRLVENSELSRELEKVREIVLSLQREVDKEYVNFERLESIMRPLRESFEVLSRELRDGQRQLFDKLDSKQDKP